MKLKIYEQSGVKGEAEIDDDGNYSYWYNGDVDEVFGVLSTVDDMEVVSAIDGSDGSVSHEKSKATPDEIIEHLRINLLTIPYVFEVEKVA